MDSFYHGWHLYYHGIQSVIDRICFITAINLLNEINFLIILIKLLMRSLVQCALLSIKERTHFITIYCKTLKGFTLSLMAFILSWYSIRYRSDSFCTIAINRLNEIMFLIILIKLIMRGSVSCALLPIKQRTHFISIYCIHLKGFTLSWMGFILSWYSIRYRSDSFHHSNKPVKSNHFFFVDYFD